LKKTFLRIGKGILLLLGLFFAFEIILRITPLGVPGRMDGYGRRKSFSKSSVEDPCLRIICLGDSLTFGYKIKEKYAWPSILGNRMRSIEDRRDIEVLNAGITGHTSAQVIERLDRDVIAHRPDLAIVWVGMNDGWLGRRPDPQDMAGPYDRPSPFRFLEVVNSLVSSDALFRLAERFKSAGNPGNQTARVSLGEFQKNIRKLCTALKAEGLDNTIFLSLPEVHPTFGGKRGGADQQRKTHQVYNTVLMTLLSNRGFRTVNLSAMYLTQSEKIYKADGIHLNRLGSNALVDVLYPEVMSALKR
jgi:lysophospholipase L1-like esterase